MRRNGATRLAGVVVVQGCLCAMAFGQSAERDPLAPARLQVEARFTAIQNEINRLLAHGQKREAEQYAESLQYFRDELAGLVGSSLSGPELHMVGLYEGLYAPGVDHSGDNHPTGSASVLIQDTGRPIVLSIGAYEPVNWNVQFAPGAVLEKVIVSGYYDQQVGGLPASVPVVNSVPAPYSYAKNYSSYPNMARWLFQQTNLPVTTLVGTYAYADQQLAVGPANADWVAQRVLTEMQPLYNDATQYERSEQRKAVRSLKFTGLLWTPTQQYPSQTSIAELTPFGPKQGTIRPLPVRVEHLAVDQATNSYYGTYNHAVYKLNIDTGDVTPLPVGGPGMPELSWPCGLTFDTKRNRVVMSSLGGEGFFYTYSEQTQNWSLLSSLNGIDLQSLTYLAADDSLYGITTSGSGDTPPRLLKFGSDGQFIRNIDISEPVPVGWYAPQWGYQLFATGDRLALITPPAPDLYAPQTDDRVMMMIIEPQTGEVLYSEAIGKVHSASSIEYVPEPGGMLVLAGSWILTKRRKQSAA